MGMFDYHTYCTFESVLQKLTLCVQGDPDVENIPQ